MTGLEKMKLEILEEAKSAAENKIAQAEKEAQEIIESAKAQAEKISADIYQKSQRDAANYNERIVSATDLQKRTNILKAKQEIIAEIIDKAYEKIKNSDTETYFETIFKVLENNVLGQEGKMIFSVGDFEKITEQHRDKIAEIAKNKGGSLTVESKESGIEDGFILVYGDVEENCTFKALFDAKRNDMADTVNKILFL